MTTEFKVEGDEELARSLAKVSDRLGDLSRAEEKTGQLIRSRAAAAAPRESGALASSIVADSSGEGVTIGSDLIYAGVQEYGWGAHNISAQPFLTPAAEDTSSWIDFYEDEVQGLLDDVKGA